MADEHWVRSGRPGHPAWLHDPDYDDRPGDSGGGLGLWVERMLLKLAIVGLVALVLVQVLLTQPQFHRLLVLMDRMEGHLSILAGERGAGGPGPAPAGTPPVQQSGVAPGASALVSAAPGRAATPAIPAPPASSGQGAATEADPAAVPAAAPGARRHLTIALVSHPSSPARLLVDNRAAGDFAAGRISVAVTPGQQLAIAGGAADASLVFRVVQVAGLEFPPLGAEWTVEGGTIRLGAVR